MSSNDNSHKASRHQNQQDKLKKRLRSFCPIQGVAKPIIQTTTAAKVLEGFYEFMDLNYTLKKGSNNPQFRGTLLKMLRTTCVKWHQDGSFNDLLFNLSIAELSMESKFTPLHLYDLKNSMFYAEEISPENLELYSFYSRTLIRDTNRKTFLKLFGQYMKPSNNKYLDENFDYHFGIRRGLILEAEKNPENQRISTKKLFHKVIKNFLAELKKQPKLFAVSHYFDYFFHLVKLGIVDDVEQLMEMLQLLSTFIDNLYEDKMEDMKLHENLNQNEEDYSTATESDDEDNTASSDSYHERSINHEETDHGEVPNFTQAPSVHGEKTTLDVAAKIGYKAGLPPSPRVSRRRDIIMRAEIDKLIFHNRKFEVKKLKWAGCDPSQNQPGGGSKTREPLLRYNDEYLKHMKKMSQLADMTFLIVVTINDLITVKLLDEFAHDSSQLEDERKEKHKLFFERRSHVKVVVNIAMKILGTLNSLYANEEHGIESFVQNSQFRKSIDKLLMTLLSIRNDPLVRSQDVFDSKIEAILLNRKDFVQDTMAEFGTLRKELINFFIDTSNSVSNAKHRHKGKGKEKNKHKGNGKGFENEDENLSSKDLIDSDVLNNLKAIFEKVEKKLDEKKEKDKEFESKIQASLMNIPTVVMTVVNFLVEIKTKTRLYKETNTKIKKSLEKFKVKMNDSIELGIELLLRTLEANYIGQGLFFNSKSGYLFWKALETSPITFLPILMKVLSEDPAVVFKSSKNSEILFKRLSELIAHNLTIIDPRNASAGFSKKEKDIKRIEIYMAVNLLDALIISGDPKSAQRRLLAAQIQDFVQQNIHGAFLEYFEGADNLKLTYNSYRPVLRCKTFQGIKTDIQKILGPLSRLMSNKSTHSLANSESSGRLPPGESEEKEGGKRAMTTSEIIEAEMHGSFLKLFNEVSEAWKHMTLSTSDINKSEGNMKERLFTLIGFSIDKKPKQRGSLIDDEMSDRGSGLDEDPKKAIQLYSFDYQIENGVYFITQLIRLYCNEQVFEFSGEDLIKVGAEQMLGKVREETQRIASIASMLKKLEKMVNTRNEYYEEYKDFLLEGYFKVIYKFLKGVLYELSKVSLSHAKLERIFDEMTEELKNTITRLLPNAIDRSHGSSNMLYQLMEDYKNLDAFEGEESDKRSQASDPLAGIKKTQSKRYQMIESILKRIENIYKVYDSIDIIQDLDRESHKLLQDKPTEIFVDIDATGSNSLKRLEEKFEVNKKGYEKQKQIQAEIHKVRYAEHEDLKEDSLQSPLPSESNTYTIIGRRKPKKVEVMQSPKPSLTRKIKRDPGYEVKGDISIHSKGDYLMDYYIQTKEKFLFEEDNLFYKVMDEGGDDGTESEELYRLFLTWIIEIFHFKLNPEQSQSKHPQANYSVILRDFDAFSWIHILDNLMTTKPALREILFNKFFTESFRIKKEILEANPEGQTAYLDFKQWKNKVDTLEEEEEEESKPIPNLALNIAQNMILAMPKLKDEPEDQPHGEKLLNMILKDRKPGWSEGKLRRKRKNIIKSDIFLSSLFETTFYLQRCIRSEVFNRTFTVNLEYYFSLTGLIKTIAEDNFLQFKELVGKMRKPYIRRPSKKDKKPAAMKEIHLKTQSNKQEEQEGEKKKLTINYLDCLYKGVYLHTKVSHDLDELVRRDRPHLFWYNIVTLDTLSEYFNGPCEYNQDHSIKKFKKLLLFVSRLNRNESNTFYLVQLEIITLVQAMFEGRNKKKCNAVNKNFKPFDIYNMIVKHLEVVYKYYLKQKYIATHFGKDFIRKTIIGDTFNEDDTLGYDYDPVIVRRRLMKYYKLKEDFKDHPILNTSVGLFMIMQTIARAHNKNYQKYLSGKKIEMAVELGQKDTLKLNQSERAKVEHQTTKAKQSSEQKARILRKQKKKRKREKRRQMRSRRMNSIMSLNGYQEDKSEFQQQEHIEQTRLKNLTYFYFLTQITGSIEIVNRQREPVTVYFQILPECMFLTLETKNLFRDSCSFSDANSKLMFLMEKIPYFKVEMESNLSIFRWIGSASNMATESTFFAMMRITWLLSLMVNISVLIGYKWEDPPEGSQTKAKFAIREPYKTFNLVLGLALIFISSIFLLIWLVFKYKFAVKQASQNFNKYEVFGFYQRIQKYVYMAFIQQPIPMMFLFHIIFTLMGLYGSPLSHSMNLHCLFFLSETVQYVVKAITSHIDQVMMTLLVGVLLTYSFSILNAIDFRDMWDPFTGDSKLCTTMLGCFGYVLDFGLRNGGGIADSHDTVGFENDYGGGFYWYKIGFNLLFFILISKFVLDIIFGIIVDSFTDMRDNQQKRGKRVV